MGRTGKGRLATAVAVSCAAVVGSVVMPADAMAKPIAAPADFNGDGYHDLVVPAPAATVGGKVGAGAVVVLYGSRTGVSTARKAVITQNSAGVPGTAEAGDLFGASTAFADLDKDGFSDLVVGAPDEGTSAAHTGMVTVLWGGKNGLAAGSPLPVPVVGGGRYGLDVAAVRDSRGPRVLVGGYDGSIELSGTFKRDGSVGSASRNWSTPSVAVTDFGDFRHDGHAERIVTSVRVGGNSGGLVYVDPVDGSRPLPVDGTTTATGDVNGDGYHDLVVGDPDEPANGTNGHLGGEITLWYGGPDGLAAAPVHISQDTAGVYGTSTKKNKFGQAVAVADLNNDGLGEIIVGVPGQHRNGQAMAGAVVVIPGQRTGTPGAGSYEISQESGSVPGVSERGDGFGLTLTVGDVKADGHPDLIIGAEGEDNYRGAVWVLPGTSTRPLGTGSVELTAGKLGVAGVSPWVGGFPPS
ncbi:VCBS repeat-containing protein [Streptomyces sp. NPDC002133]|uniref:VCBS repeat-containing protein n=1 Tax=Streptomyces sp. NPDC002133 TaxID=3154409 RepID=UPI0033295AE0